MTGYKCGLCKKGVKFDVKNIGMQCPYCGTIKDNISISEDYFLCPNKHCKKAFKISEDETINYVRNGEA